MKVCFMNNIYFYLVVHTTIHFRNFIKPRRKTVPFIFQNIKPRNIVVQPKTETCRRVVIRKGAQRLNKKCQTANIKHETNLSFNIGVKEKHLEQTSKYYY